MYYTFYDFEFDDELLQLRKNGNIIELQPGLRNLLRYFLAHRHRPISRDEFYSEFWPTTDTAYANPDGALTALISRFRKQFQPPTSHDPPIIKTIAGYGYQWTAEVHEHPASPRATPLEHDAPAFLNPVIEIGRLPATGRHLFGREAELKQLDAAWDDIKGTHVISIMAWGGVGKSALVNHWLRAMTPGYRGIQRVFGWSFYSQGTCKTAASADKFMNMMLRKFGDPAPRAGSARDKGERLARLVREERTLLILDGLELLQYAPTPGQDQGCIKDPGLALLIRELAADNPGLCVITTRIAVADLEDYRDFTAPVIELRHLSESSGVELLRACGVRGPGEDLVAASREFGGHALTLNLLGTYLRKACHGEIQHRRAIRLVDADRYQRGHAERIIEAYEAWFGESRELALLYIMGLFDRPVEKSLVDVVLARPSVNGLTDALQGLSEADWQLTLSNLRDAHLLSESEQIRDAPALLDAHPLIREYFGQRLRDRFPNVWQQAHERLYRHLRNTNQQQPQTIETSLPLLQAVTHACQAGLHEEAFTSVVWPMISMGYEHYSIYKLGATGAELDIASAFFAERWYQPLEEFDTKTKAQVMSWAGMNLRFQDLEKTIRVMQISQPV